MGGGGVAGRRTGPYIDYRLESIELYRPLELRTLDLQISDVILERSALSPAIAGIRIVGRPGSECFL